MKQAEVSGFHRTQRPAIPVHLGPARKTGSHLFTIAEVWGNVPIGDLACSHSERVGSRSDEGHVPPKDVEELGEFVDTASPKELANFGYSLITEHRLYRPVVIAVVQVHRTKLENRESAAL